MTALPKPAYVMSEPHLSGWRVILGYETLADAQAAQSAVSAPEAREGNHPVDGDWQSIAMWMGFAASVIKSGEPWTDQCHREFDEAKAAYGRLSTHPAAPSADKLRIAVEAMQGAIEWDKRTGYRMPYRVRDPLYAAIDLSTPDALKGSAI